MDPKEFLDLRKRMGMTQAVLADEMGLCKRRISKYENDAISIPRTSQLAIYYLWEHHEYVEEIDERSRQINSVG